VIGRSLDKYGEYGRDELELLKQVVREGDVIVDAGAMYGQVRQWLQLPLSERLQLHPLHRCCRG
jgi:hypothetical protein